ncbi:hypothetical protein ZEAMMB73_Zm00001d044572 [Zea mays]|uniref:Uncharacterized protein n=1 Tax=Zea mays TaxID=4577 RepID=A0A1D6NNM9_MAIZE|nr:hypothetical protein ZEAMMB73_Zm00001d044572 [Zea mays]ONM41731.1 hypothetical protein ZEAMMB73_Zm00001d044572 [Zea mays]ONM41733.1 hypothetical protein ZEAMMB73_Zm00001d044572 [Zea mays]ONM41734.1 hypothetical protein ZEAMMB73_Zm00001d044572 [Zea mays]
MPFVLDGLCLSGGSPCKWYINPDVPEAGALMASLTHCMYKPVRGKCIVPLCGTRFYLRISLCIMFLRNRKSLTSEICTHLRIREFLVTVTVKKIGDRWWYNACKKCTRTTVAHGDSYKCSDQVCATIGTPNQRLLVLIAALWF